MGYSSYKRFSSLTDDINMVIDGCGDTYEKKYYYNGTYIDLCGLSVEEYMKNPCLDKNSGSGSCSKQVNEIFVKATEDEHGVIYYQAYAKYAVSSNIKVMVASTNGFVTELDLYVGETVSKPEIGETMEFMSITLNTKEDESYQYTTVTDDINTSYDIYYKAVRVYNNNVQVSDFDKISLKMETSGDLKFKIMPTDVNYNEMTDMDEFENFCIENQYCLALYLPKLIYDKKQYIVSNYAGIDMTKNFVFEKYTSIDGIEYVLLNEKAGEDIMPFVPLYAQELVYEYKLTLNK